MKITGISMASCCEPSAAEEKVLGLSQKVWAWPQLLCCCCCCAAAARYLNFVCFPPGRLTCRLINCDKRVVRRLCEQLQQQQQQQISIYFKFLCTHTHTRVWLMRSKPPNIWFPRNCLFHFSPQKIIIKKKSFAYFIGKFTRKVKRWRSFFLLLFDPGDPSNPSYISNIKILTIISTMS